MYTIYFTNFGYRHSSVMGSFEEAHSFAISKGHECGIERDGRIVASWSPISGLRRSLRAYEDA